MEAPPISVRCDCGASGSVAYGDVWKCEACGRRWNTAQIPADDYWRIIHDVRRHRRLILAFVATVLAVLLPLAVLVSARFLFLLILLLGSFAFYVNPFLKRRLRRRIAALPRWKMHPE